METTGEKSNNFLDISVFLQVVDLFHKYEKIKVSIYLPYCHDDLCFIWMQFLCFYLKNILKQKEKLQNMYQA